MQRLLNAKTEKGSRPDRWGFHLLNQYFIFSTLLINSHCQTMINIIANAYRCACASFVPSFFCLHSNWRQRLVASTQKTCVCFHGNSGSNTSPSRWSDDEGVHRFSTDIPVFTAGRRHVTRLRWWQGNCFLLSLRVAATGLFQRAMLDGMRKIWLTVPGTQ